MDIKLIIISFVMIIINFICGQIQDRVAGICDDVNKLIAIYNFGPQICVLRGEWFWQFNSFANIGDHPSKQSAISYTKSGFYINSIPECDHQSTSNMDCDHLRKAKFLKIAIEYNVNNKIDNYLAIRRIYNNDNSFKDEAILSDKDLPWNLKHTASPVNSYIWPENWLNNSTFGPVAYHSKYNELVFIVNGDNGNNSKLIWYNIRNAENIFEWRSKHIEDKYFYIGIIEYNSELYVIAAEAVGSQKLVVFHVESRDENRKYLIYKCDFHTLLGCDVETSCPIDMIIREESETPMSEKSLNPLIIIIIVIVILVILIALIITALIIFYRHTIKSSKSRVKPRQQSKTNTVWTANDEDNTSIYTIHSITGESIEPETIRSN